MLRNICHQTKFFNFVPGFKVNYVDTQILQLHFQCIKFTWILLYHCKSQFSSTEQRNLLLESVEECQSKQIDYPLSNASE